MPDLLVHAPDDHQLFIDSIITAGYNSDEIEEWSKYRQDIKAPENSIESLEEVDFESSSESVELIPQPQSKREKAEAKKKTKKVVKDSLHLHGFDTLQLSMYPHQYQEGQVPLMLLKDNLINNLKRIETVVGKRIAEEFHQKKLFPTLDHVQLVYEHYCQEFAATPFNLSQYVKKHVFVIKNQQLPMNQIKALCVTIPIINGIRHVILQNNNVGDEFGPPLLFACFMNPMVNQITVANNMMRASFTHTFHMLLH